MSVLEEKKASTGRFPVEVQEGRDILTREDTDKLFRLLAFYRPNDPHLKDNALRAVWALTLAPYSVDDVREAVVSYFRALFIALACKDDMLEKVPKIKDFYIVRLCSNTQVSTVLPFSHKSRLTS